MKHGIWHYNIWLGLVNNIGQRSWHGVHNEWYVGLLSSREQCQCWQTVYSQMFRYFICRYVLVIQNQVKSGFTFRTIVGGSDTVCITLQAQTNHSDNKTDSIDTSICHPGICPLPWNHRAGTSRDRQRIIWYRTVTNVWRQRKFAIYWSDCMWLYEVSVFFCFDLYNEIVNLL